MRVQFTPTTVTFIRDRQDPKFYGIAGGLGESRLLYFIKKWLNQRGFELIKKNACEDGHLMDSQQKYLRVANTFTKAPHIYIISAFWAIEGAEVPWNAGAVTFNLHTNVYNQQPDCYDRIVKLGKEHNFIVKAVQSDSTQQV